MLCSMYMDRKLIANRILIELESIKLIDFSQNSIGAVTLINEALRDAKALADATLDEDIDQAA